MVAFKPFRKRVRAEFLPSCLGKEITFNFERDGKCKAFSKTIKVTETIKIGLRTKDLRVYRSRMLEAETCYEKELGYLSQRHNDVEHEDILGFAQHFYDDYRFQCEDRVENVHSTSATVAYCRQRALWAANIGDVGIDSFDRLRRGLNDPSRLEEVVNSFFKVHPDGDNSPDALEGQFGMLISAYGRNFDVREQDRYRILIEIRQLMKNAAASGDMKPPDFFLEDGLSEHTQDLLKSQADYIRRFERRNASVETKPRTKTSAEKVSWNTLLELWKAEKPVQDGSVFIYNRAISVAIEIFGHDDAACLRKEDFFMWRDCILAYPTISRRTAKQNHLKALNRLLNIGVHRDLLDANYLKAIPIHDDSEPSSGEDEYTSDEVKGILEIATKSSEPVYKWIPLILATSGARCKEITSLWHDQIKREGDIWCFQLKLTKDGFKPKNKSSYRTVPIHKSVLNAGFIEFLKTRVDKPLFYDPPAVYGKYHPASIQVTRLGEYIKKIRPDECKKAPCHGFRHTIISLLRRIEPDVEKRAYIVGHKRYGEADTYGTQFYEGLKQTIDKFPTYGL